MKVKSHIGEQQAHCRNTPLRQVMANELADFTTDICSDRFGDAKADKAKLYASQALLRSVCKRVAALESSLRAYATDVPLVAVDVITTCETIEERRRAELPDLADQNVMNFATKFGHNAEFIPYVDPPYLRALPRRCSPRRSYT